MRILITTLLLVCHFLVIANAADIYIRADGGNSTECDGSVDAAKNETKKCALNYFSKEMKYSATNPDNIIFGKSQGNLLITAQPTSLWITVAQFNVKPEYYLREAQKGRKVILRDLNGVVSYLKIEKY